MKWTFAIRYLFSRKSHSLINIISWVSLVSIMVPTAAMICLMSVYNGFENLITDMYLHTDADMELSGKTKPFLLRTDIAENGIEEKLLSCKDVEAISFVLCKDVLVEYCSRQKILKLSAVDERYNDVVPLSEVLYAGDLGILYNQDDGLVLGKSAMSELGTGIVNHQKIDIHILAKPAMGNLFNTIPLKKGEFQLTGAFSMDTQNELLQAYTSLEALSRVASERDRITFIAIKSKGGVRPGQLKQELEKIVGDGFQITTRNEKHASYMTIMKYEKWSIFFISIMIMMIASLAVMGTMMILIIEKKENLKTMMAMGASRDFIRSVFFREGVLLSAIGIGCGIILGLGLCFLQITTSIIEMPADTFLITAYPVKIMASDVVAIALSVMAILSLIAYVSVKFTLKRL